MPMYRRKPLEVEAFQLTDTTMEELANWCGGKVIDLTHGEGKNAVEVYDQFAKVIAYEGNWIVKKHNGRFVVMSDKRFTEEYE